MISTYYTNNVAADENFLDHMYRIVSYDLIFLLHVRRYHELDPSQPILTRDGVGNLILTWYRVELSLQMGSYIDYFDTRTALISIPRWDVVGQKVLKIILLKGDLRRSLALTSSQFFLILMIHHFSG